MEKRKKARTKNKDKRKPTDGMDGSDPKEKNVQGTLGKDFRMTCM